MPFPLTDLKRSYGRSGGRGAPPDVRPYLLAGADLASKRPRLAAVIQWHEARLGWPRGDVDFDDVAALVGDYRLARCLAACLQQRYRFQPTSFAAAVQDGGEAGRRRWSALLAQGVDSSSRLRLRVFEHVSATHGGFIAPQARQAALAEMGETLGLGDDGLETLLWLDAEERDHLTRVDQMPDVEELAAAYNRRALETLLVRTVSADLFLPRPDGPAIKRLYFLMKRTGLVADLEVAEGGVRAHLFGPLELFGPRTRHGDRFAQAILQLLRWTPGLSGSARVLVNDREYVLHLKGASDLLARLAAPDEAIEASAAGEAGTAVVASGEPDGQFDSGVEARLFATLRGMERRGDARGWHVEREPEPLVQDGMVLVPDFLLTRASAAGGPAPHAYVEVIGFWTPAYRQRKRQKLSRLSGTVPLVLVIQEQLAPDFQGLPFPTLTYKQRPSAADLIHLVEREFGRAETRLRDAAAALKSVPDALDLAGGVLADAELRTRLGLAAADDLRVVLTAPGARDCWPADCRLIPGVGLCRQGWLDEVAQTCDRNVHDAGEQGVSLERLRDAVRAGSLPHADLAAEHLEALLPQLGFEVLWASLFEAVVRRSEPPSAPIGDGRGTPRPTSPSL